MIECVDEALGAKPIEPRVDICLQGKHVGRRKLLARFQHPINSFSSPGRPPLRAQAVWMFLGSDPTIGSRQDSPLRIETAGQLVERNVALPFMRIIASTLRETAVARCSNWNVPSCLISDVAVHVGIHRVL